MVTDMNNEANSNKVLELLGVPAVTVTDTDYRNGFRITIYSDGTRTKVWEG